MLPGGPDNHVVDIHVGWLTDRIDKRPGHVLWVEEGKTFKFLHQEINRVLIVIGSNFSVGRPWRNRGDPEFFDGV